MTDKLRQDELDAFKAAFDMFDKNQDGTISTKVSFFSLSLTRPPASISRPGRPQEALPKTVTAKEVLHNQFLGGGGRRRKLIGGQKPEKELVQGEAADLAHLEKDVSVSVHFHSCRFGAGKTLVLR